MALVFLAGGGSVGHLAPGFAVRDALRDLGHDAVFVTPGEERERAWFASDEPARPRVPAPRFPKGLREKIAFPFRMLAALSAAKRHLRERRPCAVLALGGWPCFPTALAASMKKVALHVLVTDAVPGVVAKRLARRATRVWLADARASEGLPVGAPTEVVGPIVRRGMTDARRDPARFGLDADRRTLLVVGGSLGAQGLNARARAGLAAAVGSTPGLSSRIQVLHSTGTEEEAALARADYARAGVRHAVVPFIHEMGVALATADLVLCRGGAGTLAEVLTLHRPAVVVPYPHHADRQQFINASPLVDAGRAVLVEEGALDAPAFRREVVDRLLDERALSAMREGSPGPRGPGAADTDRKEIGDGAATIARDLVRSIVVGSER